MIRAPFTPEQVRNLEDYQNARGAWKRCPMHPFTCPNHSQEGVLVPTVKGWVCQFCDYTQDWAHDFMAATRRLEVAQDGQAGKIGIPALDADELEAVAKSIMTHGFLGYEPQLMATIQKYRWWLEERDGFLRERGYWSEFADWLQKPPHPTDPVS
jgi:hypothetical protein